MRTCRRRVMEIEEQYQAFCDACEELRSAKIILADAKVSKILRSIVSSPNLVEIVGDALVGYDFEEELSKCTGTDMEGNQHITLPAEPYRVIALVFSILSEFDGRKLDLQEFVHQYFNAENLTQSFARFNNEMIEPFRVFLCEWVGYKTKKEKIEDMLFAKEEVENKVEDEEISEDKECECDCCECECEEDSPEALFEDLKVIFNQIKETIKLDTKIKQDRLDDLNITLDGLLASIELANFKILNALLISLNNLLTPIKSVRFYNMELQNRLAKFYDSFM